MLQFASDLEGVACVTVAAPFVRDTCKQIANKTWNLDANVTLLRFYQFCPANVKSQLIAKILVKAIMQAPNQDYKSCITLLPERLQQVTDARKMWACLSVDWNVTQDLKEWGTQYGIVASGILLVYFQIRDYVSYEMVKMAASFGMGLLRW